MISGPVIIKKTKGGHFGKRVEKVVRAMKWDLKELDAHMGLPEGRVKKVRRGTRRASADFALRLQAVEQMYADEIECGWLKHTLYRYKGEPRFERHARIKELEAKLAGKTNHARPADLAQVGVVGPPPAARPARPPAPAPLPVLREGASQRSERAADSGFRDRRPPAFRREPAAFDGAAPGC